MNWRAFSDTRFSLFLEYDASPTLMHTAAQQLNASRSVATLKLDATTAATLAGEEAIAALAQLIAICASLLESQLENENLLAVQLLNRVECKVRKYR